MEPWTSRSHSGKQTMAAVVCSALGLLIMAALRDFRGGTNAMAGFLLGALLLVLGVLGLLVTGKQTIVVDPRTRRITVEDSNRFGRKTRVIPFQAVADVSVGFLGKKSSGVTSYYLVLKLRDGEEYPLFSPGRFFGGASDRSTVEGWRQRLLVHLGPRGSA
jgi:hypothetical protein